MQETKRINPLHAITNEPPELDFTLPGLLRGTVGAIAATGSTGKSFLALQLCVMIATKFKVDFLNLPMPNSATYNKNILWPVYITAEDPAEILHHRLHSIGRHVPPEHRRLLDVMEIHSAMGLSPYVITQGKSGPERNIKLISALKTLFFERDVCFIDTLNLFHGLSENSNDEMKLVVDIFKEMAQQCKTSIVFLHHTNKLSTLSGKADEQQASRGASALSDNVRWQWNLRSMTTEESEKRFDENHKRWVLLSGSKINYDSRPDGEGDIWLYRDPENRGVLIRKEPKPKAKGGKRDEADF